MSIRIVGPFIDKLSLSLMFDVEYTEGLVSLLRDSVSDYCGESYIVDQFVHNRSRLYRWAFRIWLSDSYDEFIHVSAIHIDPTKNQLRLEFNPAKIEERHIDGFRDFLFFIFGDSEFDNFRNACVVTRIDVAYNLIGVRMDEMLVYASNKQAGGLWGGGRQGIETAYCGSRNSRELVRVYHKPFQSPPRNLSGGRRRRKKPRVRCEVELKPNLPIGNLHGLRNPFRNIVIASLEGVIGNTVLETHETRYFVDSCLRRGTQNALSLIGNKRVKKKYRGILGLNMVQEINFAQLWNGWRQEVDRLYHLMGGS